MHSLILCSIWCNTAPLRVVCWVLRAYCVPRTQNGTVPGQSGFASLALPGPAWRWLLLSLALAVLLRGGPQGSNARFVVRSARQS